MADGLDYGAPFDMSVKGINLRIVDRAIVCQVEPTSGKVKDRVKRYINHTSDDKVNLFREAFGKLIAFEMANRQADCLRSACEYGKT